MKVLMPLPSFDFDPTESAIVWKVLLQEGHQVVFATPEGKPAQADPVMVTGNGLGPLKGLLMAFPDAVKAYAEMEKSVAYQNPLTWKEISSSDYAGLLLPGGHAPKIKEYLESEILQKITAEMFAQDKAVAAVCHGVVLAARSKRADGKSVLYNKKTTSLLKYQELMAFGLTCMWMGNYYRTYPETVQDEVKRCLKNSSQFISGPFQINRDSEQNPKGFFVRDGNYLSARWPGDIWAFAGEFSKMLTQ